VEKNFPKNSYMAYNLNTAHMQNEFVRNLSKQFDFKNQAREWGIPIWQHPQLLFTVMGILIIITDIVVFLVGRQKIFVDDPFQLVTVETALTTALFIISFIFQKSFEQMAEASRMKTEFISVVSHQLRTPVTNLTWVLDALEADCVKEADPQKKEYFRLLEVNTQRMKEMITNLLIVSRLEQNKMVENGIVPLSLVDIIKDSIEHVKQAAEKNNIEISFKSEDNIPEINVDEVQLKLIIDNLIVNAVTYNKPGGKVDVVLSKKNSKHVMVSITDTGIGIPKDDKKYISDKFFRATNSRQTHPEGSGLGLYIVASIVKKMKGNFDFKSEEGKGSTFWFTLPVK